MKTRIISELKNGLCFHLREVTVQEQVMTLVKGIARRRFKVKSVSTGELKRLL